MFTKTPLTLNGQPVGRFRAGWILLKETWRFMMLDKELLFVPVIASFLFGIVIVGIMSVLRDPTTVPNEIPTTFALLFMAYVSAAFIAALSQAVISHIVYIRAHGGDANLGQGFTRALTHSFSLFVWSMITSTIGLIINIISGRSEILGRIVASILGATWRVLTYFVVPAMVIDNVSAFASIPKSVSVFKQTFGETIVSNISYRLIFFLIFLLQIVLGVGLTITALIAEREVLAVLILLVFMGCIVLTLFILSVFSGILVTLLYIYATEGAAPNNFNPELLEKMLAHRQPISSQFNSLPPQTFV